MQRRKSRKIIVGVLEIGDGSPISVESMTATDTKNIEATIEQVEELRLAGCDIVRIAIYDEECTDTIRILKSLTNIPLVADIHFDYRLAIASIDNGIDMVRINPGNIGTPGGVKRLVAVAKERQIPIRIGVNSGSLPDEMIKRYGNTSKAMVESVLKHVSILEDYGYDNILLSLKSSDVIKTVKACREISQLTDYPLHLGVTEAGTVFSGSLKSSIGIGALLLDGIGDTIRVSLTAPPVEEVRVGHEILKCLGLRKEGVEIISCPTCGRCRIDIISLANTLKEGLKDIKYPLKIAIMGCAVNGPGEAKEADIGIAGGLGKAVLFKKGKVSETLPFDDIVKTITAEVRRMAAYGCSDNSTGI